MKKIDKLFARGVRNVSRMPHTPMQEEQIATAAATAKSGAGIWILSHLKEILLCTLSVVVGMGGTLLATYLLHPQEAANQPNTKTEAVTLGDSLAHEFDFAIDTTTNNPQPTTNPQLPKPNNQAPTPNSPKSIANGQELKDNNLHPDPVIIKKTIVQHDTVKINHPIILKDTVYVP